MIKVKVVRDREFQSDVMPELEKAFQEFKRQFGVGFEISGISEWNSRGILSRFLDLLPFRQYFINMLFGHLMRDLKKKVKANNEIVIGFTGKTESQHKATFGLADGNYVLIGICKKPYSYVILHEIGHVFGADDQPDLSIMHDQGLSYTYDFSDQDRKIIARSLARSSKASKES